MSAAVLLEDHDPYIVVVAGFAVQLSAFPIEFYIGLETDDLFFMSIIVDSPEKE